MRVTRLLPFLVALAVSGCGGCVNGSTGSGRSGTEGDNGGSASGKASPMQGPGPGGGKMIHRITEVPPALRAIQSAQLKDGG